MPIKKLFNTLSDVEKQDFKAKSRIEARHALRYLIHICDIFVFKIVKSKEKVRIHTNFNKICYIY